MSQNVLRIDGDDLEADDVDDDGQANDDDGKL